MLNEYFTILRFSESISDLGFYLQEPLTEMNPERKQALETKLREEISI
jgi:hypothetical protein